MMRIIHLIVVCVFVAAAAHVYKIKFESTLQAERVAKIRTEIKRERDAIASLRAEWSQLESPARIEKLAQRHLALKPVDALQFDTFAQLPERPPQIVPLDAVDPIAVIIENADSEMPTSDPPTGSVAGETAQ
jgi:cell division protein FtsL